MAFGICSTSRGCKNKNVCHLLASISEICSCKRWDGHPSLAVWTSLQILGRRRIVLNSFVPQSQFWKDKALRMFVGLCQLWGLVFVLGPSFNASFPPWNKCELKKCMCRTVESGCTGKDANPKAASAKGTVVFSLPLLAQVSVEMACAK